MQITKRAKVILGILLALVLALTVFWWTQRPQPSPTLEPVKSMPAPKTPAPKAPKADDTAKQGLTMDTSVASSSIPIAGNLGRITALRAEEEELMLEAKIAKLRKEKEEARQKTAPVPPLSLPALTPPSAPNARPAPTTPRGGPVVVSVQGAGGQISATIRTGSGQPVIVRKGSRLGDAVVQNVSRQGVSIMHGGKVSILPFE